MDSAGFPGRADSLVGRKVLNHGAWVLVIGIGALALWFMAVGLDAHLNAGSLRHAIWTAEKIDVGPALFAVVAFVFWAEQKWPAVPRPARSRAHIVDASYLLLFVFLAPLISLLNTGFYIEAARHAPWLILSHLSLLPQLAVVALILIGIDAMNWVAHVANHRYEALWRLHALHHSQEDMSVFTTFRTHPLAHVSYLLAMIPALVLSASGHVPEWGLIIYGCLVTLPHANLRWSFGALGRFVCSPAYHRLHHSRTPIDGKMSVNYGFVLTVWDRLSGTAVFPAKGAEPVLTGIGGRPVPIEQTSANPFRTFIAQLTQPFRLSR